jgi:Tfp pilus assembly protein PilF
MADAWNNLGLVLWNTGELKEAAKCVEKALELDTDVPKAHRDLAVLHARRDDHKEATRKICRETGLLRFGTSVKLLTG